MKNIEQEKKAIVQAIRNSISWAKDKDFDLLYNTIANDENYLEVHPEEKIVKGFSEFKKSEEFFKSEHFRAVGYKIRDMHITLSSNKAVAWWYCQLDDMNEWKGQGCNWMNVRWTGVLEKRDDRWQIMQMHFSYAEGKK